MKDKIARALSKVLQDFNLELNPLVESPKNESFGDYTTNVALIAAKVKKENPNRFALEIVELLKNENLDEIERIEAVGGFINFHLSQDFLRNQISEIIDKGPEFGSLDLGKGKKAKVEFVSANPTGPLHIGNARGGPIGDVLSNVLEKAGYKVTRQYLHNDVGGQVKQLGQTIYYELNPDKKTDEELTYKGEYIKHLASKLKTHKNESFEKLGELAVEILFKEIMEDIKKMGIEFDEIRKESDLRKDVPKVIDELEKRGLVKERDVTLWFAPSDEFLKDRETVVRKSDGEYTYFASDIAYHKEKFQDSPSLVVDVLGSNHSGHVPRLQAAVKALGFDVNKFKVILYQYVRIKKGETAVKMSKRAGEFVTAREVLNKVGKYAFRFFLLMAGPDTHMDFDLELAKEKANENPVFYVQYAHSRISSIFKKSSYFKNPDLKLIKEKEELELLRHLVKFPQLVGEISHNLLVHKLTNYVFEVSSLFHKLYESHQVISKDKNLTRSRLALLKATQIVLQNTLDLLGVEAPDHM